MGTLRTKEGQAIYDDYKANGGLRGVCNLCNEPSKVEFKFWRIIQNNFPYDKIAQKHDMLVPKRHVTESEFSKEETQELKEIKHSYVQDNYEFLIEGTMKMKTIPEHFHLHVVILHQITD